LIQALIPIGLEAVAEELKREVELLTGAKHSRQEGLPGHYAVFGQTLEGKYLTIVFELKPGGVARPITGWDMGRAEIRYYKKQKG